MLLTAVCNQFHSLEQQLYRWLFSTLDRLPSNELTITLELIASMLGVRREGITEATGRLQHAGLIRYLRGHITLTGRARSPACVNVMPWSRRKRSFCCTMCVITGNVPPHSRLILGPASRFA